MKILIDNYGKAPQDAWPRACTCYHCHSVLRVEADDIREDSALDTWRSIRYRYFICPLCSKHTLMGHNTFQLPETPLEPLVKSTAF
jgi:hypothetical protein